MNLAGCVRVVLGPDADKLVEMMSAQNRRVPREIIEIVHDDGDEQIQHEERTEENERHEVDVSYVGAAIVGLVVLVGLFVAGLAFRTGQHDVRPSLTSSTPEKILFSARLFLFLCHFSLPLSVFFLICHIDRDENKRLKRLSVCRCV